MPNPKPVTFILYDEGHFLVRCPHCYKQFCDPVNFCPHCGDPILHTNVRPERRRTEPRWAFRIRLAKALANPENRGDLIDFDDEYIPIPEGCRTPYVHFQVQYERSADDWRQFWSHPANLDTREEALACLRDVLTETEDDTTARFRIVRHTHTSYLVYPFIWSGTTRHAI